MRIKFLGTGGGRFIMITQKRKTGGLVFYDKEENTEDLRLYVDPGPGGLVNAIKEGIKLRKLDGLIVSHAHLDHCNDAEAIIEAMTNGCKKERGILMANSTVLHGTNTKKEEYTQVISNYHQNAVSHIMEMKEGEEVKVKGRTFNFLQTKHGDPNTMAFKIQSKRSIGFITDTEMFDGIFDFFVDCEYLVVNVLRPIDKTWRGHLNIQDVAKILNSIRPEIAVLHHFGYKMIHNSLKKQKNILKERLKSETKVLFPHDFQEVCFEGKGLEKFV